MQGNYAADQVVLTVGGHIVTGFVADDHIAAEFNEERTTATEGADGYVAVSQRPSMRLGKITFRLDQTAGSNGMLAALTLGGGEIAIQVLNLNGGEAVVMPRANLSKEPGASFGRGTKPREWSFVGAMIVQNAGSAL